MQMPARLRDALKPCSDVDTVPEDVLALDRDVSEIDPDPEQHPAINGHSFVPLGHHLLRIRLHRLPRETQAERPSPVVLTIRPPCFATRASVTLRCSRSVRAVPTSSRPMSRE
jgi:hypothetical protein